MARLHLQNSSCKESVTDVEGLRKIGLALPGTFSLCFHDVQVQASERGFLGLIRAWLEKVGI